MAEEGSGRRLWRSFAYQFGEEMSRIRLEVKNKWRGNREKHGLQNQIECYEE